MEAKSALQRTFGSTGISEARQARWAPLPLPAPAPPPMLIFSGSNSRAIIENPLTNYYVHPYTQKNHTQKQTKTKQKTP